MKVHLFIPCSVDLFYPEIGINTARLLKSLGCEVLYNEDQTCCGNWINEFGLSKMANGVAQKLINNHFHQEYLVCPDSACTQYIQDNLAQYDWSPVVLTRVQSIQKNLFELTDFIVKILKRKPIGLMMDGKSVFCSYTHNACRKTSSQSLHSLFKDFEEVAFESINDYDLLPANSLQSLFWPKLTDRILAGFAQKIQLDYNGHCFIDSDVVGIKYFEKYLKRNQQSLKVMHTSDFLLKQCQFE